MPRPKGSKNKKKIAPATNLEELIAQKSAQRDELGARFTELATELKSIKSEYKKVEKELSALQEQKAAADAAREAEERRKAVQDKIDQLVSEGKSLEDIMSMLG